VSTVNRGGDADTYYVDTTGWLPSNGLSDSVHPNDVGHAAIAAKLAPIVKARLGTTSPTVPPTSAPPTSRPPTSVPPTSTPPTSVPPTASSACAITYALTSQWQGGFQADVTVRNNGAGAINGWNLTWTLPSGQTVSQIWNATVTVSGGIVRVTGSGWNGTIAAGGTVSFGFIGTSTGTAAKPTGFALNGTPCTTA
jgi:cellulase/cellobiase CelA1